MPSTARWSVSGRSTGEDGEGQHVPPAWVYLLRCRDGSLYTGWTVDLTRRLERHGLGRASRYTASRRPVTLAAALPMRDRTAARREEARIKRLSRADKLALVARAQDPAVSASAGSFSLSAASPSGGSCSGS